MKDRIPDHEVPGKAAEPPSPKSRGMLGHAGFGVVGVAAVALCCGGPLLPVAIATGGMGAWLASNGALLAGAAVILVAAAAGAVAVRRRS